MNYNYHNSALPKQSLAIVSLLNTSAPVIFSESRNYKRSLPYYVNYLKSNWNIDCVQKSVMRNYTEYDGPDFSFSNFSFNVSSDNRFLSKTDCQGEQLIDNQVKNNLINPKIEPINYNYFDSNSQFRDWKIDQDVDTHTIPYNISVYSESSSFNISSCSVISETCDQSIDYQNELNNLFKNNLMYFPSSYHFLDSAKHQIQANVSNHTHDANILRSKSYSTRFSIDNDRRRSTSINLQKNSKVINSIEETCNKLKFASNSFIINSNSCLDLEEHDINNNSLNPFCALKKIISSPSAVTNYSNSPYFPFQKSPITLIEFSPHYTEFFNRESKEKFINPLSLSGFLIVKGNEFNLNIKNYNANAIIGGDKSIYCVNRFQLRHKNISKGIHSFCTLSSTIKFDQNVKNRDVPRISESIHGIRYHRFARCSQLTYFNYHPKLSVDLSTIRNLLFPNYCDQKNYRSHFKCKTKIDNREFYRYNAPINPQYINPSNIFNSINIKKLSNIKGISFESFINTPYDLYLKENRLSTSNIYFNSSGTDFNLDPYRIKDDFHTLIEQLTRQKIFLRKISFESRNNLSLKENVIESKQNKHNDGPSLNIYDLQNYTLDLNNFHFYSNLQRNIYDTCSVIKLNDLGKQSLEQEILLISNEICSCNSNSKMTLLLGKRSIFNRLNGNLFCAFTDITKAMSLETRYCELYWNRALIFYIHDFFGLSLHDLRNVTKLNRHHSLAFKLIGEILVIHNKLEDASFNYTEAIRINNTDYCAIYRRGEIFELGQCFSSALEDFEKVASIYPDYSQTQEKLAKYYFELKWYTKCITQCTNVLQNQPKNILSLTMRGWSYINLSHFEEGTNDILLAINLYPNENLPYFYLGSYFRLFDPFKSLKYLSLSIFLGISDQYLSYLHRGIVYEHLGYYAEAKYDFQRLILLNTSSRIGHYHLGNLLLKISFETELRTAYQHFSIAYNLDSTDHRSITCRAETHYYMRDFKSSLKDYSRASHLEPKNIKYHFYRGKVLLKFGNLCLARKHLYYLTLLSDTFITSRLYRFGCEEVNPISQCVIIENFIGNYESALVLLNLQAKLEKSALIHSLYGKTYMKLYQYSNAHYHFTLAIKLYYSYFNEVKKLAEVLFLKGKCEMSLNKISLAISSFSTSISLYPYLAHVYYERGLSYLKLNNKRGLFDLNKCLVINPGYFKAYLSRALYYSTENFYSKAILNCDEAISLCPQSIRAYFYRGTLKVSSKSYFSAIEDLNYTIQLDSNCSSGFYNRGICFFYINRFISALQDFSIALLISQSKEIYSKLYLNRGLTYLKIGEYYNALCDFINVTHYESPDESSTNEIDNKFTKTINEVINHNLATICVKDIDADKKIYNSAVQQVIGYCLYMLGQVNQSVNLYGNVIKLNPLSNHGYLSRGNAFMDYKNSTGYMLAKADYSRSIHIDPVSENGRINLGYLVQSNNRLMLAWNLYSSVLKLNSRSSIALESRSVISLLTKDLLSANNDLDEAIKMNRNSYMLNTRGIVKYYQMRIFESMHDFLESSKLCSTFFLGKYNAMLLLLLSNRIKEAEVLIHIKKFKTTTDQNDAFLINQGILNVLLGNVENAVNIFLEINNDNPKYSHLYSNLAACFQILGRYAEATQYYIIAKNLNSNYLPLINNALKNINSISFN